MFLFSGREAPAPQFCFSEVSQTTDRTTHRVLLLATNISQNAKGQGSSKIQKQFTLPLKRAPSTVTEEEQGAPSTYRNTREMVKMQLNTIISAAVDEIQVDNCLQPSFNVEGGYETAKRRDGRMLCVYKQCKKFEDEFSQSTEEGNV